MSRIFGYPIAGVTGALPHAPEILRTLQRKPATIAIAERIVVLKALSRDVPSARAKLAKEVKALRSAVGPLYLVANPRHQGSVVNADIPKPKRPGWWVDEKNCDVCGKTYLAHRAPSGNDEALQLVRQANKAAGDDGGGYRSRGPMLWARKILKLEHWYETHMTCGQSLSFNEHQGRIDLKRMRAQDRQAAGARATRRAHRAPAAPYTLADVL